MRSSAWSSLAISACRGEARLARVVALALALVCVVAVALVLAAPAAGHVDVSPPFLSAGRTGTLLLTAHNDREETMTGFSIAAPTDLETSATGDADWRVESNGERMTWRGGTLAEGTDATFRLVVTAPIEPGPLELTAEQLYPGNEKVSWPVRITVTPAGTPSSSSSTLAALLTAGLLVTGALLFLARQRRDR